MKCEDGESMSEQQQWTPGPWVYYRGSHSIYNPQVPNGTMKETSICVVNGPRHNGPSRRDANAHLIAAAPDLYEALEGLVLCCTNTEGVVSPEPHDYGAWLDAMVNARAALQKARSGTGGV